MTDSTREAIMSTLLARVQSAVTKTFTGDTTLGSAIITNPSPVSGLFVGLPVFGAGLANGAVVDSIDTTARTITLDQPATATASGVSFSTGFQTVGRRVLFWSKVAAQPALFLRNTGDNYVRQGILELRTMHVEVWIYSRAGMNPEIAPSIGLNNLVDAVEGAFAPDDPAFNTLTLGGLVQHCWIEGDSSFDPGDVDGQAKAIIPVRILFPPCLCGAGVSGATIGPAGSYTGPLDIVSGALVAYGQRALAAAKRGSAIYTIRKSGGSTQTFNSDAVAGEISAPSITMFLGGADGFVTSWVDQSGNGNDAGNPTQAQQPQWLDNMIGGKPAVQNTPFVTQLFTANNLVVPVAFTAFVVWKCPPSAPNGTSAVFALWDGTSNTYLAIETHISSNTVDQTLGLIEDGATQAVTGYFAGSPAGAPAFPNPSLLDIALAHGTDNAFSNGAPLFVSNAVDSVLGTTTAAPFIIGNDLTADPADFGSPLALAEIIVYPSILSDDARLAIRRNIATYYGITLAAQLLYYVEQPFADWGIGVTDLPDGASGLFQNGTNVADAGFDCDAIAAFGLLEALDAQTMTAPALMGQFTISLQDTTSLIKFNQQTYCSNIVEPLQLNSPSNINPIPTFRTGTLLQAIGDATKVDQINALLAHGGPAVTGGASPTTDILSSALQLAIWKVIYEVGTTGYDLTTGRFRGAGDAAVIAQAQIDLDNVLNGTWLPDPTKVVTEIRDTSGIAPEQAMIYLTNA